MKSTLRVVALLSTVFATSAMAYNVNKVEVFPPYLNVGCSQLGKDTVGSMGLTLNKLSTTESESSIKVSIDQTLKVCELSIDELGNKTLAWKNANPFKGFEVQYFDVKSNSLKTRTEVIDQDTKFNRFEVTALLDSRKTVLKSLLSENKNNTNVASLEINKLDLVNQNDLDILESGTEIKKTFILFNTLNTTTLVNNQKMIFGDQIFSGRNVTLTLTKSQNLIKVKNIEIK
jgi:hypothetical protein